MELAIPEEWVLYFWWTLLALGLRVLLLIAAVQIWVMLRQFARIICTMLLPNARQVNETINILDVAKFSLFL